MRRAKASENRRLAAYSRGTGSRTACPNSRLDAELHHITDYAADWRPRYAEAYRRQNKAFVHFARTGAFPTIAANAWDGYCAAAVAEAGVRALKEGRRIAIEMPPRPDFYTG